MENLIIMPYWNKHFQKYYLAIKLLNLHQLNIHERKSLPRRQGRNKGIT